jgi:hypothetical protein
MVKLVDVVEFLIQKCPGRTQRELAEAVFGKGTAPTRVQYECHVVVGRNGAERRGSGSPSDPFRYFPAEGS